MEAYTEETGDKIKVFLPKKGNAVIHAFGYTMELLLTLIIKKITEIFGYDGIVLDKRAIIFPTVVNCTNFRHKVYANGFVRNI